MTNQLQASRTCVVCGQKKPLIAFLELAGDKGHTYGDICATCRGSGLGRKKSSVEEAAEKSGGTSRVQIDNKAKVKLELERKEELKHSTALDYEEKLKKEFTETEKSTESENRESNERKRRESYFEQKNQAPAKAGQQAPGETKEAQAIHNQGFYHEKTRVTKDFNTQTKEQQLGGKAHGLSPEYVNRYVSSTGRSAESLFGRLLGEFLGGHIRGKATGQVLGQFKQTQETKTPPKTPVTGQPQEAGNKTENKAGSEKENLATEFVRNNLKLR